MSQSSAAWLIAGVVGAALLAPACLLQLETDVACGDGFVDRGAGEECEPDMPETFLDACRDTQRKEGVGACDPATCRIQNDVEQCGVCGDGKVDPELGEDCDGDSLRGQKCEGGLQCSSECTFDRSQCEKCGDGVPDEGEECEPDAGGFAQSRLCAGSETQDEIPSPNLLKPYASGVVNSCANTCVYNRSQCGFCGDGERDDALPVDDAGNYFSAAEWCDGDQVNRERLLEEYGAQCPRDGEIPNAGCNQDDCTSFVERWPEQPRCCREKGTACATLVEPIQCCYAYAHPGEDPCNTFSEEIDGEIVYSSVCK